MGRGIRKIEYATSDGRPFAESDWHREIMTDLIKVLEAHYAGDPQVYVSGNLLLYYVPGNKHRRVSPDVFVVKGVSKHERPYLLLWEERKSPNLVIEVTSFSTRSQQSTTLMLISTCSRATETSRLSARRRSLSVFRHSR